MDQIKTVLRTGLAHAKARGAEYADARFVFRLSEEMVVADGHREAPKAGLDFGVGIRCLARGSWGFAFTSGSSAPEVKHAAALAARVALASASANARPVPSGEAPTAVDSWSQPVGSDPFALKAEDKLSLLAGWEERLRLQPQVGHGRVAAAFVKDYRVFANSVGSLIEQESLATHVALAAFAGSGALAPEVRSARFDYSGGFEVLTGLELRSPVAGDCADGFAVAERLSREAAALLEAPSCPTGPTDLIVDPSQLALQMRETVGLPFLRGHPLLTGEANGLVGAPGLSVRVDPTIPGAPGTYRYDDDGLPGQAFAVIANGLTTGGATEGWSRPLPEGSPVGWQSPAGHRARDYGTLPAPTLGNLVLEPGRWRADELIRDTGDGLYVDTPCFSAVEDPALRFHFGAEAAWEIKDGCPGRLLRNPGYTGMAHDLWLGLDGVADGEFWSLKGFPGGDEPALAAGVAAVWSGFGGPPARFRGVRVQPTGRSGGAGGVW